MPTYAGITRGRLFILVVPLLLTFVLVLSACGTNTPTTTGAAPGTTATTTGVSATTPTATPGQPTAEGCPSSTVVTTVPAANVVLTNANSGNTVTAHKGDIIQVNLSFGHNWQGPMNLSPGLLTTQGPAGYSNASAKACTWRFLAASTGTVHLTFAGRPICKKNEACPMYIMAVPFTIVIK